MSISTVVQTARFNCNGTTGPFTFSFPFTDNAHIYVYLDDALLTEGVDYTLTGAGAALGSVTLSTAVASGILIIDRVLPMTQPTVLANQGPFFSATHEAVFDRLTMLIQQLWDRANRAIRFPKGEVAGADINGVEYASRHGKVLGFNGLGQLALMAVNYVTSSGALGNPWADIRGYASLADAISQLGGTSIDLVVWGGQGITADLTVPANIRLDVKIGGTINRAAGKVLTISGPFSASESCPVFVGAGTTVFSEGAITHLYSAWFDTGDTEAQTIYDALANIVWIKASGEIVRKGNWTGLSRQNLAASSLTTTLDGTFNNTYKAFKVVVPASGQIGSISFKLSADAGVDLDSNIFTRVAKDNSGVPADLTNPANIVGDYQGVIYAQQLYPTPGTPKEVELYLGVSGLTPDDVYWIVFEIDKTGTGDFYLALDDSATNDYAYSNNGTAWTDQLYKLWYKLYDIDTTPLNCDAKNAVTINVTCDNAPAVRGTSTNSNGVEGYSDSAGGVYGQSDNSYGVRGDSTYDTGVRGIGGGYGVNGVSTAGYGGYFSSETGIAGYFAQTGTLTADMISPTQKVSRDLTLNGNHDTAPLVDWVITTEGDVLNVTTPGGLKFKIRNDGRMEFTPITTPVSFTGGVVAMWADSSDGKLWVRNTAGALTKI